MRNRHQDHRAAEIKCPFFRGHTHLEISCEGITDDTSVKLMFQRKETRILHEDIFCMCRYQNCELYRAINEKYEE